MGPHNRKTLKELKFGKKPWTMNDFEVACEMEGVEIVYLDMKRAGFYWICDGIPTIVLSSALRGIKLLRVALHELGHYFNHTPDAALYLPNSKKKREVQAERFALSAMLPLWLLKKILRGGTLWDLEDEYGLGMEIVSGRYELYLATRR